jgi:isoleucyl-tRNA synthetase
VTKSQITTKLKRVDCEDWFMVSNTLNSSNQDILGSFDVDGDRFDIIKSTSHKCPRCWKQKSLNEDALCKRCEDTLAAKN